MARTNVTVFPHGINRFLAVGPGAEITGDHIDVTVTGGIKEGDQLRQVLAMNAAADSTADVTDRSVIESDDTVRIAASTEEGLDDLSGHVILILFDRSYENCGSEVGFTERTAR